MTGSEGPFARASPVLYNGGMKSPAKHLPVLALCALLPAFSSAAEDPLRRSLVKIFTVTRKPNYYQPWQMGPQTSLSGSGCVIEGDRILTNAHVVSDQVFVQVQKAGDTRKVNARVEFVGHDTELAVLKTEDPAFFQGTAAVRFGELPEQRDKLAVYGFPLGGDELSITEGIVSRIEVQTYTHSQRDLLVIQTDAAINPGNSGGPVFKDGKLVGVAFQSFSGSRAENIGYAVPIPVVGNFLNDIQDGAYDGVPILGIHWEEMENEGLRSFYNLKSKDSGVLVTRVLYGSSAWGLLQENDVITEVAGIPIARDGSFLLREGTRVNFSHLISMRQVGESLKFGILRAGKPLSLDIPLKRPTRLVPGPQYDLSPSYFVFAGLVFTPLTYNYLAQWNWNDVDPRFKYFYANGLPSESRKQVVLVSQVLAQDVNAGYHKLSHVLVEEINGIPITQMRDVPKAFEKPAGRYHVIGKDHPDSAGAVDYYAAAGVRIILDAEAAQAANARILKRYAIPADRSQDMMPVSKP